MSRTIDVYSTNKVWHVNAETGTLLRRRSGDERTAVNVNRRHSKEKWKSKGKKGGRERERGTERESLGNFLSTVNLKQAYGFSKLSNSICGLAVEKFRQFASLRAFRGFTVNFFRIFPPRDSRGLLHTSNQRHRSSISLENVPP